MRQAVRSLVGLVAAKQRSVFWVRADDVSALAVAQLHDGRPRPLFWARGDHSPHAHFVDVLTDLDLGQADADGDLCKGKSIRPQDEDLVALIDVLLHHHTACASAWGAGNTLGSSGVSVHSASLFVWALMA